MRSLTGIQPSGKIHLGNYFGMMKPAIELQEQGEAFLFHRELPRADLGGRCRTLREATLDVALDFLACGLDPKRTVLFRQSDVPEVTELTWMLSIVTADGPAGDAATLTRTRSPRASRPTTGCSRTRC